MCTLCVRYNALFIACTDRADRGSYPEKQAPNFSSLVQIIVISISSSYAEFKIKQEPISYQIQLKRGQAEFSANCLFIKSFKF